MNGKWMKRTMAILLSLVLVISASFVSERMTHTRSEDKPAMEQGDGETGDGELGDGEPGDGETGDDEPGDGETGDGETGDGAG